jgi:hypothetical protein
MCCRQLFTPTPAAQFPVIFLISEASQTTPHPNHWMAVHATTRDQVSSFTLDYLFCISRLASLLLCTTRTRPAVLGLRSSPSGDGRTVGERCLVCCAWPPGWKACYSILMRDQRQTMSEV